MGIEKIEIENYKSIKKCSITLKQLNLLIGENGCGKTNVISAMKYFYQNMLTEQQDNINIFDQNNKFSNQIKIAITYNCEELKKIVKHKLNHEESNNYYERIDKLINSQGKIYLELTKIKNMPIKWNIKSYYDREIIYYSFPFYFIEARNINSKSWEYIWKDIGDFLKLERTLEEELEQQLESMYHEEGSKIGLRLSKLENILEDSEIQVKKYTPKEYASMIAKIYFKGENFKISEYDLNYFSDGTNAFNYINILIEIVSITRKAKIKFPVIIIDEPEISLHHKYIDRISEKIIENNKMQYVVATHSARLLKNVFRNNEQTNNIIHLKYQGKYTTCSKMKLFTDERQNSVINDEHANSYFSDMLLLVEGESELQLFNDPNLRQVYPILKKLDIIKAATDSVIKDGVLPSKMNYRTPYLILIDMDKVIVPHPQKNEFVVNAKDGYFKRYEKEKYYYGEKRENTYQLQKRIRAMLEKCRFHHILPFYACTDKNYYDLINCIKDYFLQYHTFVNSTTIEGLLVNSNNSDKFWNYYVEKYKPSQDLVTYYQTIRFNEQINLLRLLVSGKTDYILNLKQLDKIYPNVKTMIQENVISQKTNGWISDWIEYYLCDILKIPQDENTKQNLKRKLKEEQNKKMCRDSFNREFREISNIFKEISKRLQ